MEYEKASDDRFRRLKNGEKVDMMIGNKGGNSGILYLVLFLFGLGIIDYLIIQDAINKKVDGII